MQLGCNCSGVEVKDATQLHQWSKNMRETDLEPLGPLLPFESSNHFLSRSESTPATRGCAVSARANVLNVLNVRFKALGWNGFQPLPLGINCERSARFLALALFCFGGLLPSAQAESQLDLRVSLILEGIYFHRLSEGNDEPAGFGHGHDHGHGHSHGHGHHHDHGLDEGFNLGHSELAIEARMGEWLEGALMLGFDDKSVEVEEVYLRTLSLPAGLQLKGGKFLSDIGYINSHHNHDWDFVDRPLFSEFLFGHHGLQDVGVQLSYVPATPWYTRLGLEAFQGDNSEGIARFDDSVPVEQKSGPRLFTAFARTGPDLGAAHALQIGASAGFLRDYGRLEEHGSHGHALVGDGWFSGIDAVYRHYAGRSYGHGDWRVGGEYFLVSRNVDEYLESQGGRWIRRGNYTERQDGLYLQAVYGLQPRWEAGVRAEALGLTNRVVDFHPTRLESLATSYRYSAQLTFRPVEPLVLRAQINYDDFAHHAHDHGHGAGHGHHQQGHGDHNHGHHSHGGSGSGLGFLFQVNVALGAHGAHRF